MTERTFYHKVIATLNENTVSLSLTHPVAIFFSTKLNLQLHSLHRFLLQPLLHLLQLCVESLRVFLVQLWM